MNDKSFKVRDGIRIIKHLTFGNEVTEINSFDIEKLKSNITKIINEK